jgi:hypothetical protein
MRTPTGPDRLGYNREVVGPRSESEACKIRKESSTPFIEIVRRGPARFKSNPPTRFVCDGEWSALPMTFALRHNDDDYFVYEVSWPVSRIGQSRVQQFHHLYFWKKKSLITGQINRQMDLPAKARWCDTYTASRNRGQVNYIRRVLVCIGIKTAETF